MKIKLFSSTVVVIFFLVFALSANAQSNSVAGTTDSSISPTNPSVPVTDNSAIKQYPEIQEKEIMLRKKALEGRSLLKDKRDSYEEKLKMNEFKMKERKKEFKEKLNTIHDERKKALVERIDEKISTMNSSRTGKLSSILEKLEMVLDKISGKAQIAESKGVDASTVHSAIATARTAIDVAKAAVADQATKPYTPEVSSEAALKTSVGSIVSTFRKDLKDVHKTVIAAKQAVQAAEKELAKVREGQQVVTPIPSIVAPSVSGE